MSSLPVHLTGPRAHPRPSPEGESGRRAVPPGGPGDERGSANGGRLLVAHDPAARRGVAPPIGRGPRRLRGAATVALLEAEPQFGRAIPPADAALAARVLVLPRLELTVGRWCPPARDRWPSPTAGLLLLDSIASRHVVLGDRVATQLLGPGDILDPWGSAHELLPCSVTWTIDVAGSAAVLDGRFATAARRWPSLATIVQDRLGALGDRLATHLAICQLPRVELRILALLWMLAERFGRVAPGGVVVPLRLTHRLIGQLIGAQRPTVSLALSTLADEGHVIRRDDGTLLLADESRAALAPRGKVVAALRPSRLQRAEAPRRDDDLAHGSPAPPDRLGVLEAEFGEHQARTEAALRRTAALCDRHPGAGAWTGSKHPH